MRIAQVAPLFESVPPKLYGGTERVVSYLTEELVARGHDVTLFAAGDSVTSARLVPCCRRALRLGGGCNDHVVPHLLMCERVLAHPGDFDVIHFHINYLHFPLVRRQPVPTITTIHCRLDEAHLPPLYGEFIDVPLVSISHSQRSPLPWANWLATIHHGLPEELYQFSGASRGYLVFAGRISPDKGPDVAIEIARRAGLELRIAAKVDQADRAYFERVIKPLLSTPRVRFIGEVNDAQKNDLLGGAMALLFPIDWPEPFGLVMIEALACGTPVIAMRRGAVPEVLDHGECGFIVDSVQEAVEAVAEAPLLSRRGCRDIFERRFTAQRMAAEYERLYEQLAARPLASPLRHRRARAAHG